MQIWGQNRTQDREKVLPVFLIVAFDVPTEQGEVGGTSFTS